LNRGILKDTSEYGIKNTVKLNKVCVIALDESKYDVEGWRKECKGGYGSIKEEMQELGSKRIHSSETENIRIIIISLSC
jgi:hypothetical protein